MSDIRFILLFVDIFELIIAFSLVFVAGYLEGVQNIIWFKGENNVYWRMLKGTKYERWYKGHISICEVWFKKCPKVLRYNPKLILLCDPWHLAKHLEMLALTGIIGIFSGSVLIWLGLYIGYGMAFYYNYHYVLPIEKKGNFVDALKELMFWRYEKH